MNELTNPKFIKDLFRHYQLKPKDYMGQNFLVDEMALDSIVEAGDLKKTDTVVEVGPGLGVLTQQLAERAGKVIAIEKDSTLLDILDLNLREHNNVTVVNQDVLSFDFDSNVKEPYKVVANIPYYLTSHLFQYFLALENKPQLMVLLVQKEVGHRVTAKPGDMSLLAISVQLYADPQIVAHVSRDSFWPSPQVDSVVLKIIPKQNQPKINEKEFFKIVKVGFAAKRKQLHNNLANGLDMEVGQIDSWLRNNNIDPTDRAEDLSLEDWIKLCKTK
jgi:16S rRNA (adenine1518-N6/adenine1519-N6)-dimethyltransferase